MMKVRDGSFDLVVLAGPRIPAWPSVGVRALSFLCSEAGLQVGLFGGESIRVRGVIPSPGTGGLAIIEDTQGRIHRIRARALVKVTAEAGLPDPFPGWRSPGLLPLATAERLRREGRVDWPVTASGRSFRRGLPPLRP